jgi:hypothetical protein
VLAVALVAIVSASEDHYGQCRKSISPYTNAIDSVVLTQVDTHLQVKNSWQTIVDTCRTMYKENVSEKRVKKAGELRDDRMCKRQQTSYLSIQASRNRRAAAYNRRALQQNAIRFPKKGKTIAQKIKDEHAGPCAVNRKEVDRLLGEIDAAAKIDADAQATFKKIKAAFEYALEEITQIYRVLNGQGTLSDRYGRANGLMELSAADHMKRLASQVEHPLVKGMIQTYTKTLQKVSGAGDMDAVNALLFKMKENLATTLQKKQEAEWARRNTHTVNNLDLHKKMNNNWKLFWECRKRIGNYWIKMGTAHTREAQAKIMEFRNRKIADKNGILYSFLRARCRVTRNEYDVFLANKNNEQEALLKVIEYIEQKVLKKPWVNNIGQTPYRWKLETKPEYVTVKNTFSTVDHRRDDDVITCKDEYATVYTKLRIMTEDKTGRKFIDPNDMTHSKNTNTDRTADKRNVQCELYPIGIPVGRARSCKADQGSVARIDLSGTPYKFDKVSKAMFKILGKDSTKSTVKMSKGNRLIELKAYGRCGDVYGDDLPANMADYRSDPIPIISNGLAAPGR